MSNGRIVRRSICIIALFLQYNGIKSINITTRIVGGKKAVDGKYPFYAFPAGSYNCGATLIWKDVLLSAAHCMIAFTEAGLHLGGTTIDGRTSTYYPVKTTLQHPLYNSENYSNDIMLVVIDGVSNAPHVKLNFNETIPSSGDNVTVIGYGNTVEGGSYSYDLLTVDMHEDNFQHCRNHFGHYAVEETMICTAGPEEGGKDSCQGDSGGPVFLNDSDTQIGIISFGDGCAKPNVPSVNVRVSSYKTWIEEQICSLSAQPPNSCIASNNKKNAEILHREKGDFGNQSRFFNPHKINSALIDQNATDARPNNQQQDVFNPQGTDSASIDQNTTDAPPKNQQHEVFNPQKIDSAVIDQNITDIRPNNQQHEIFNPQKNDTAVIIENTTDTRPNDQQQQNNPLLIIQNVQKNPKKDHLACIAVAYPCKNDSDCCDNDEGNTRCSVSKLKNSTLRRKVCTQIS